MKAVSDYIERVAIALDILINVILGGPSNQTFSARNYYWQLNGKPNIVWLIDILFWWDKYHCWHSWVYYKTTKNLRSKYIHKPITTETSWIYDNQDWIE